MLSGLKNQFLLKEFFLQLDEYSQPNRGQSHTQQSELLHKLRPGFSFYYFSVLIFMRDFTVPLRAIRDSLFMFMSFILRMINQFALELLKILFEMFSSCYDDQFATQAKLISHWHGWRLSKEVSTVTMEASPCSQRPPLGPLLKYLSEYAGLGIFSLNFAASCVDFCKFINLTVPHFSCLPK